MLKKKKNKDSAENLSHLKMHCTKALDIQKELALVKNFPNTHVNGIIDIKAMKDELLLMNKHTTDESYTYGFMNMLLTHYFNASGGYVVCPQSKEAAGLSDFIIKKDGDVVAIVESKALNAKNYPFTHLYAQATEYANTNNSFTSVFVIVNKGDCLSFGVDVEDFHSMNKFKKKSILFDGFIGLQVHEDLSVKPVPQLNVFEPQHKLYEAGHSWKQDKSIYTSLEYIKSNKNDINPKFLDFGPQKVDDGGEIDIPTSKARFCVTENGKIFDKYN